MEQDARDELRNFMPFEGLPETHDLMVTHEWTLVMTDDDSSS